MKIERNILRISHNYFSFLSGVVISVAIELFVGIFSGGQIALHWPILLIASILSLISSLLWAIIAWNLDSIQNLAIRDAPDFMGPEAVDKIWEKLITPRLPKFRLYFVVAVMTLILGLALLPIGFLVNN